MVMDVLKECSVLIFCVVLRTHHRTLINNVNILFDNCFEIQYLNVFNITTQNRSWYHVVPRE